METFLGISAIILTCLVIIGLAVFILWIIDAVMGIRKSPKEIAKDTKRFVERLKNPDFDVIETHFCHSFPKDLKLLYKNEKEILRDEFELAPLLDSPDSERYYIAFYEPADMGSVVDFDGGKYFTFANDGCGNCYIIDPILDDPPVRFYDHETGDIDKVCDKLSEFMNWKRI